jgi:hypothetical protein
MKSNYAIKHQRAGAQKKTVLDTELAYFKSIKKGLLRHHRGKFALIVGKKLVGNFDRRADAYRDGIEKYGNVPMLINLISLDRPKETQRSKLGLLGDVNR